MNDRRPRSCSSSAEPDLLHEPDLVVEQPLLRDRSLVVPRGDGAELDAEALARRWDHLFSQLHRPFHRAPELGDGTRMVAVCKQDLVRSVDQMVVREGLEKLNGLKVVVAPSPRRRSAARPVHGDILGVTFSEGLPQGTSRSGIPCVVQRRHQLEKILPIHFLPSGSAGSASLCSLLSIIPLTTLVRESRGGPGVRLSTPRTCDRPGARSHERDRPDRVWLAGPGPWPERPPCRVSETRARFGRGRRSWSTARREAWAPSPCRSPSRLERM